MRQGSLRSGDIVWADFDPSIGHEFQKKRPAVVIEADNLLLQSSLATIIPITSNMGSSVIADDVVLMRDDQNKLYVDSVIKVQYITSFDYGRFDKKIGRINADTVSQIKSYLKKHFDL
jgi:mRNA interferase MazF